MSDYNLETRSSFLRLLEKIFLIGVMVIAFSPVCYGFQWEGMEITPSITSITEYNDNIFYVAEDKTSDVINRVEPGLDIRIPGTREELEFRYKAGFEFFANHTNFNAVTHAATGSVRIQPVQHLIFTCNDNYYRAKDLATIDIVGLRRQREWFYANTAVSSLEYAFGLDRTLRLSYTNDMINFDNSTIDDSRENIVNGVLAYRIGRRSSVTLNYTYTHGDYDSAFDKLNGHDVLLGYEYRLDPLTSILANSRILYRNFTAPIYDYTSYNFLLGFKRNLTSNLSIEVQGGYLRFDPGEIEMEAINTYTGILTVNYRLGRTTFNLVADKGYEEIFADIETLGYTSSWGVTGSIYHTLYKFLSVELTGMYRHRDYQFEPRVDRFWTARGALVFTPVKWFKGELSYEHTSLDATGHVNDYETNQVMLTLQLSY